MEAAEDQETPDHSEHGSISRIDLTSGFMKHIIRNQQNRDEYDKEVKIIQEQQKTVAKENRNQAKRPRQAIYVPPARGNKVGGASVDEYVKDVFKLQYESPDKEISEWLVRKGDDPYGLAERFGRQCRLTPPLIKALGSFINEEMDKRGFHS